MANDILRGLVATGAGFTSGLVKSREIAERQALEQKKFKEESKRKNQAFILEATKTYANVASQSGLIISPEQFQMFAKNLSEKMGIALPGQEEPLEQQKPLSEREKFHGEMGLARERLGLAEQKLAEEKRQADLSFGLKGRALEQDESQFARKLAFDERALKQKLESDLQSLGASVQGKSFEKEKKLRSEYIKDASKFIDQRDWYGQVKTAAQNPSAAGDLALIFSFMKMLDPTSVVREGEQATAQNARGVPEGIRTMYNRLLSGEKLGENQRSDFVNRSEMLYQDLLKQQSKRQDVYSELAGKYGLDANNVVIDLGISSERLAEPEERKSSVKKAEERGFGGLTDSEKSDYIESLMSTE